MSTPPAAPPTRTATGPPVEYTTKGYGAQPCPGCGRPPSHGDTRVVEPGVWQPWHAACYDANLLGGEPS